MVLTLCKDKGKKMSLFFLPSSIYRSVISNWKKKDGKMFWSRFYNFLGHYWKEKKTNDVVVRHSKVIIIGHIFLWKKILSLIFFWLSARLSWIVRRLSLFSFFIIYHHSECLGFFFQWTMFSNLASYIFGSSAEEPSLGEPSCPSLGSGPKSSEEEEWVVIGEAPGVLTLGSLNDVAPRPSVG